jgi:hypothetical protein
MSKVYCSVVIPAPVEEVWATIRDFNAQPTWHPMIADSTIEDGRPSDAVGCVRSFHLVEGGHLREQLLALDDLNHTCIYTIVESPLSLANYLSELRLRRVTADETTFAEWMGQFDVADTDESEVCNRLMRLYSSGLHALADRPT